VDRRTPSDGCARDAQATQPPCVRLSKAALGNAYAEGFKAWTILIFYQLQ